MRRMRASSLLMLVAVTVVSFSATDLMAQRGGGRPGGGFGGFGGGFGGGSVLDLAAREDVQKHLDLLPDQVDDLKKLADAERAGMRERFSGLDFGALRNGSEEDRAAAREKMQEVMRKATAETQKKVDAILLPHQSKRLSQLAMQRRLRGGVSSAFGNEELAGQLGISNRQREELQAKARAAEEELREKVAKLREEMQADLLAALTPEQRAKYESLIGAPFEFAQDERPAFGRGGQGGGRPGGGGGGQGGGRPTRGQRPGQ